MNDSTYRLERIDIKGVVQGVGFRPFVHNLAHRYHLCGYVQNNPDGVVIEAEGEAKNIEAFVSDIQYDAPVLSRIVELKRSIFTPVQQLRKYNRFEIRPSEQKGERITLVSPDVCVCDDCLKELFDYKNRRYLYPFINCTNCGPRFTIIRQLPYDRPFTTMERFSMCPECEREYYDPLDRRFHAQPNACPVCGPHLKLVDGTGNSVPGDPLLTAIELLKNGRIVAIKGLGGFHLAVDSMNENAVKRLRMRKHREEKPLALMVGTVGIAHQLALLSDAEERMLISRERPIEIVHRRDDIQELFRVAESVAPHTPYLGIMLPYTPLHYLLFFSPASGGNYASDEPVFTALIMTSGNISEEPICKDNEEVLKRLAEVADAFLLHDRDIYIRSDDSVIAEIDGKISFIRRSRGFTPMPIFLSEPVSQVLAFGGELKNTLCLTEGKRAFVSQHIGDLENLPTLGFFKEAVAHFTKIMQLNPRVFAYDLHPEYLSTKYFMKLREELDETVYGAVGVQHHHAHIASVLAEQGYTDAVIGFSMDGTGYGLDNTVWGGEVLVCTAASFARFAHLDYVPLPGGSTAVREPWRMAFSYLRNAFVDEWQTLQLPCLQRISSLERELMDQACRTELNCPLTSSLGRLFDAVSSLLDIQHYSAFEGQAAMMLEMYAAEENTTVTMPFTIRQSPVERYEAYPVLWGNIPRMVCPEKQNLKDCFILDYLPLVRNLVEALQRGIPKSELAAIFHNTVIASFLEIAVKAREMTGINTIALSGGCWQNRILSERFQALLRDHGFDVMINRQVPVNDGGLSLGQAYVAASILTH
ncbi:MAG TPA: carbamoyltransferase HypF [Anaerolineae bacterium]|nr:carbamoyltransferase HypF [Anaerolineae bacterium]